MNIIHIAERAGPEGLALDDLLGPYPRPHGPSLARLLHPYRTVGLAEIEDLALLKRLDTKYVLPAYRLPALLASLPEDYALLEIEGTRLHPYHTLYWDTPGFTLLLMHHNGRRRRYKVRCRSYLSTQCSFLEVKLHTHKCVTAKARCPLVHPLTQLTPFARAFFVVLILAASVASCAPAAQDALVPTSIPTEETPTAGATQSIGSSTFPSAITNEAAATAAPMPTAAQEQISAVRPEGWDSDQRQLSKGKQHQCRRLERYRKAL